MNCSIEKIQDTEEEAWILAIPTETVKELLILLVAYKYEKIEQINFIDLHNHLTLQLSSTLDKKGKKQPIFKAEGRIITSNWIWFEAAVSMLLEVCMLGWTETSHIDFEFASSQGNICVNLTVTPPNGWEIR